MQAHPTTASGANRSARPAPHHAWAAPGAVALSCALAGAFVSVRAPLEPLVVGEPAAQATALVVYGVPPASSVEFKAQEEASPSF